jgi:hypothetical protein
MPEGQLIIAPAIEDERTALVEHCTAERGAAQVLRVSSSGSTPADGAHRHHRAPGWVASWERRLVMAGSDAE